MAQVRGNDELRSDDTKRSENAASVNRRIKIVLGCVVLAVIFVLLLIKAYIDIGHAMAG
jgi:hypothetical protein